MTTLGDRSLRPLGALLVLIACVVVGALAIEPAHARSYQVLHSFTGKDGANPSSTLVRDRAGNLYGTTVQGGDMSACRSMGCGVVFMLDKTGKETVLHTFTGGADGWNPYGNLVRDTAGNLYGSAANGGIANICNGAGCGVVFRVDTSGSFTVLYSFTGGTDGAVPFAGLLLDAAGNLYGTTSIGGDLSACMGLGCGVVFMLDTTSKETVLHTFAGKDGADPVGDLVRDSAGDLYGTTLLGGDLTGCYGSGCGVVFKLDATGKFIVLHTFAEQSGGELPFAGLVRDEAGNLYGTTTAGVLGGVHGAGTVFKVHGHTENVLYAFKGGTLDGTMPFAGLVRDVAGNLYGTTYYGGRGNNVCGSGCGTAFEIDATGTEKVLIRFDLKLDPEDGALPRGGLFRDVDGSLYGTTTRGGDPSCDCGVVFKLTP
jgi:uncharacterized repeat protein (TIGR03803 family)